MNFTINRHYIISLGILLTILGLFIPNPIIGIIICMILAMSILYDEKIAIFFLLIFIPIRPFLIIYNSGYKFIGDILILFLLLQVIIKHRKNIRQLLKFNRFEIAYILFIVVGILSALMTGVTIPAIIMQVRAFILFFLLFYIIKRMEINNKDIFDFSLITFLTAVTLSIQGIIEKISVRTLLLPEVWANAELALTNKTRVYGLIGGPNELGLYLAISFIISIYLLINSNGKFKIAVYTGMTLILTVFLLTYSRGAVLAVIPFLVVYFLINKTIHNFKPLLIIILASVALFFSVVNITKYVENNIINGNPQGDLTQKDKQNNNSGNSIVNNESTKEEAGLNRFTGALSKENVELSSADGRLYYVKKSLEVFKDRPIIGYGFGTFGGAATLTYSSPIYEEYGIGWNFYSDNQYIQIIAETGLIGTAFMVIFIINLIMMTWNLSKGHDFSPLLIFFLVASITSGVVYNILENDVFTMYYFILLGSTYRFLDKKIKI